MRNILKFISVLLLIVIYSCSSKNSYELKITYLTNNSDDRFMYVDKTETIKADNDSLAYRAGLNKFLTIKNEIQDPNKMPVKFEVYDHDGKFVFSTKY